MRVGALIFALAFLIAAWMGRYSLGTGNGLATLVLDRWTGTIYWCSASPDAEQSGCLKLPWNGLRFKTSKDK
jgi:hypothetical protein